MKDKIKLDVTFKSQLDNHHHPTGTCNVTSLAMVLDFWKVPRKQQYRRFPQLEDELYAYMLESGLNPQSAGDLSRVATDYGLSAKFTTKATIEQVKQWVASGKPAIIHGYFTSFGHIVVVVGYDDTGFIVHDPYGEWFATGYRTDLSGAYLNYSYQLIRRTCIPDGDFWVHFIEPHQ